MNMLKKFWRCLRFYFQYDFINDLKDMKRRFWDKCVKLAWHRLFLRKNEFHPSLDLDTKAMMAMNEKELKAYREDVLNRRALAHKKSL